jgi:anti-sigma-K factor RskA
MSEDRIDELIALAALGELSDADEAELDQLLDELPEVADELRADLGVAAALQEVHAEQPAADLRARVMAQIEDVDQEPGSASVTHLARRATDSGLRQWLPRLAAAAAALLVVGGAFAVVTRNGGASPIEAVVEAPDADERVFAGDFDGRLVAIASTSENAIVVDGSDIDSLEADQTYQLWLVDGAAVASVGTFRPDSSGSVETRFDDVTVGNQVLAVTVEPEGGSETPTLPIVATAG